MARQDRDRDFIENETNGTLYTSDRSDKSTRDYKDTRENRAAATESRNLMQDLAWFIPLALVAVAGYYLYQNYYATPVRPVETATVVTPVAEKAVEVDKAVTAATASEAAAEKPAVTV